MYILNTTACVYGALIFYTCLEIKFKKETRGRQRSFLQTFTIYAKYDKITPKVKNKRKEIRTWQEKVLELELITEKWEDL